MERKGWPEEDELVVCTVKQVKDFGAFTELDEYGQKEGLIHISEVAAGWVKYIRDHVREGQKIVCKVLNVEPDKHHIDLSLKDVNEHQRREKIHDWKNEQKAENWINYVAEVTKTGPEKLEELIDQLYEIYDSVYAAFEEGMQNGADALVDAGVWVLQNGQCVLNFVGIFILFASFVSDIIYYDYCQVLSICTATLRFMRGFAFTLGKTATSWAPSL
jgi:translation initiation factor 2 subunit 1